MSEIDKEFASILQSFDEGTEAIHESNIHTALHALKARRDSMSETVSTEYANEIAAFAFTPNYTHKETGWGIYYGPMMVMPDEQDRVCEWPSVRQISSTDLDYYESRAVESKNALMRLRYADLVWEMTDLVSNQKPDHKVGRMVVKSTIETIENKLCKYHSDALQKLDRGIEVALQIGDSKLVTELFETLIDFETQCLASGEVSALFHTFDQLRTRAKRLVTSEQESEIVASLTTCLNEAAKQGDWYLAEPIFERLRWYRTSRKAGPAIKELAGHLGQSYEVCAKSCQPGLRIGILTKAFELYSREGLRDDAERIGVRLKEVGEQSRDSMQTISTTIEVPADEVEAVYDSIAQGELADALENFALYFVVRREQVEERLKKMAEQAPLVSMIQRELRSDDGIIRAKIGSLDDDLDGRVVHEVAFHMRCVAPLVRNSMAEVVRRYGIDSSSLLDYLYLSPLFDERVREQLQRGFQAYLDGDYIAAIHILVPRVESALRRLLEIQGGSIFKIGSQEYQGLMCKTLDQLMSETLVRSTLGEDIVLNLKVILSDQRGLNSRNEVCHGLAADDMYRPELADRIVQGLLLLALVRAEPKS